MPLQLLGRHLLNARTAPGVLDAVNSLLLRDRSRRALIGTADRVLHAFEHRHARSGAPDARIRRERTVVARSILHTLDRLLDRRQISPHVLRTITELWGRAWSLSARSRPSVRRFQRLHGCAPPWFLVLSPTNACNLSCPYCYAGADPAPRHLSWRVLDRIMREAKQLWGVPLFVFSGGEPLLYRSEGHDLLDAVERHPDCLFLLFTNGTRIDASVAARLGRLGNLTPAISVEGMEEGTDARRGDGQFRKSLEAMRLLRDAGVPFGISATLTRDNQDDVLSEALSLIHI